MSDSLHTLRIANDDKAASGGPRRRRRRWPWILAVLILLAGAGWFFAPRSFVVQAATVSLAYPSRTITTLTASGYIVAQRKAALATKATAQLVWLGVEEGSRVKKGDILARLESADVEAARKLAVNEQTAARFQIAAAEA